MNENEAAIKARLEGVLSSVLCPVVGCWPLHGCEHDYYFDGNTESYVLEVWPVSIPEQDRPGGNGKLRTDRDVLYELAEFDFSELAKEVPLEHFHFSQWQAIFEIGWKEFGHEVELRIHIEPRAPEDDGPETK
jgi:hypothetical protein